MIYTKLTIILNINSIFHSLLKHCELGYTIQFLNFLSCYGRQTYKSLWDVT